MKTNKSDNYIFLYKKFINDYVLRLIGEERDEKIDNVFQDCIENDKDFEIVQFDSLSNELIFGRKQNKYFKIKLKNCLSDDNERLLKCIVDKYLRIAIYKYTGKKQHSYITKANEYLNYQYAVQVGICEWVVGSKNNYENVEKLLNVLESWSSKTYEGKKVSYGIVINLDNKEEDKEFQEYGNFLTFLNDEFSAVLTDPITSIFELSTNCKLLSYKTIIDENNNKVEGYELINNLPYRFANIITKTVDNNKKVGVFLLNNGDIIVSKNKQILFVKRNSKWLNFNVKSLYNAISEFIKKNRIENKIIDEIYSTALDVSFSHTGGIIALVPNAKKLFSEKNIEIIDRCDYISSTDSLKDLENYLIQKNKNKDLLEQLSEQGLRKEINKKLLKRIVLQKILNNTYDFLKINRKLRNELVSLDGACVIDNIGQVYSFGAIIQNESGSFGGGRGAAAKKLSEYGMAIKISTDGYIEVFVNQNKVYVIK